MKKRALFLAMVAALVAFAACNKEADTQITEGESIEAVFEVSAPELATKAISDGLTATKLFFYLYDKNGDLLFNTDSSVLPAANAYPVTFDKLEDKKWSVKVRLIKDMQYQVVFWAQKPEADAFTLDAAAKTLSVNYSKMTLNADDEDAFWGTSGVFTVDGPATKVVTLKRPFAQLNVAIPAEDLGVASFMLGKYSKSATAITTNYTLSSFAYTTMNLLDGTVSDNAASSGLTLVAQAQPNADITIGGNTYKHMAMAYILVGSEKVINDVTLTVNTGAAAIGAEGVLTRNVLNVPLQRNYRTNIIGSIFSVEEEFKVEIDNAFGETGTGAYGDVNVPDYVPTFDNIAALNAELVKGVYAVALDVAAETVIDGTINLPNTTDDVYLYILNDHSAAGNVINVVYTEGAAAHPANLYIYAKNLNTLNGTVPDTHVEIYSYSHIGTGVMETSGTTLVIQPFAFYGNLVIRKGGLRIEGRKDAETGEYEKDKDNKEAKGIVASVVINVPAGEQAPIVNDGLLGDESTTDNTAVTVESGTTAITGEGTVEGDVEAKGENTVVTVATEVNGEVNVSDSANVTVTTEVDVNNDGGTVSAGDGYVYDETTKEVVSAVAQNDTKYYLSLADAVAEAQEGDTINLLRDDETSLTGGGEIEINKSLTITGAKDDKGNPLYTIFGTSTVTGTNDIFITGSGTVTLSNLKVKNFGNNANSDANHSPVYVSKNFTGTVNLNNIYVSNFNRGGIFLYGGTFNVEDCYIDCANSRSGAFTKGIEIKGSANGTIKDTFICNMERSSTTYSTCGIEIYGNGSVVVDQCTIVSNDGDHSTTKGTYGVVSSRVGDHNPSGGSTVIKDCMFSCTNACLSVADDAEYGPVHNYSFTVDGCDFDNYIATWSATSSITINSGSYAEDVYADAGTIIINGGEFGNFAPDAGTNGSITIYGGTFDADPSTYVAEGCLTVDNGDGTWTVGLAPMDYNTFNAMLYDAGGVWTAPVTVVLKESQRNIINNGGAQFYMGRIEGKNTNGTDGNLTVRNVTFTYEADDDSIDLTFGEIQSPFNGILTMENCTFIGVSVSPWCLLDKTPMQEGATLPNKAEFKNCTFKNLVGRYGIHQNAAKNLVVTGCTFENMQRGIHTNCPAVESIVIKNNTFTGIDVTKGVLCLAEGNVVTSGTTIDVSGNDATGQVFLRQLCSTITLAQVNALLEGNTYGTAYVSGSIIPTE